MKGLALTSVLFSLMTLVQGYDVKRRPFVCIPEWDSRNTPPQTSKNATETSQNATCPVKYCEVCNRNGVCKQCYPRYLLKGQPARCVPNCCPGHHLVQGKCRRKGCSQIRNCLRCPGFQFRSCVKCKQGYYRYKRPLHLMTKCVKSCPYGYQVTKGNSYYGLTCKKKRLKCPLMPGCIDCPRMDMCHRCQENMSIVEGIIISRCVKQCPKHYHNVTENNASVCFPEEGCLDRFCIMCKRGWYKMIYKDKKCHRKCPVGHYVSADHCMKCPWGCESCKRPFSCDKCSRGLMSLSNRLGIGDRCVFTCPRGYTKEFVNGTGHVCHQDCTVSNCANCESFSFHGPYHCDFCKPGFHKLHSNSNDECVKQCPAGYRREIGDLGGSVCRKDKVVSPQDLRSSYWNSFYITEDN